MLAKLLPEQGDTNPTLSDKEGLTLLTHATKTRYQDVVKLLLERGKAITLAKVTEHLVLRRSTT